MARAWFERRERGSRWGLRVARVLALRFGRRAGRAVLWPITAYFFCFHPEGRAGLRRYYEALEGRRPTLGTLFAHYLTFARTVLDRAYLLARHRDAPRYEIRGFEAVGRYLDEGQGVIVLGAHLGSFEAARAAAFLRPQLKVQVIMHAGVSPKLNETLMALNPDAQESVAPLGGPTSLLAIKEFLAQGGLVGLMGDRALADEATYAADFLGREAHFPSGPLRLAAALRAPVFFFSALYRGPVEGVCRYELVFEPLCGPAPGTGARGEWMRQLGERYVRTLQAYCRLAPDNWFNFYDFWQAQSGDRPRRRPARDGDDAAGVCGGSPMDRPGTPKDLGTRGKS